MKSFLLGRRKIGLSALTAGLLIACSVPATANDRQYKVEAAFLYSFFNYITWPGYASPQALKEPVICITDRDPVAEYLEYLRHKVIMERILHIRQLKDREGVKGCNMLFVRHWLSSQQLQDFSDQLLTVIKPDDPLDRGAMIELIEEGERISIRINQPEMERNGFQVSSHLLKLAQRIK